MRYGYCEKHRIEMGELTLVLGFSDESTNPKWQYPAHLERNIDGYVVKVGVPTRFGWKTELPLKDGEGRWIAEECEKWFDQNLHEALTTHIIKGHLKLQAKGKIAPAIIARQKQITEQKAIARQEAKQKHESAMANSRQESEKVKAEWLKALQSASEIGCFDGWKQIKEINGEGLNAIVTLEGNGGVQQVEVKWLTACPLR